MVLGLDAGRDRRPDHRRDERRRRKHDAGTAELLEPRERRQFARRHQRIDCQPVGGVKTEQDDAARVGGLRRGGARRREREARDHRQRGKQRMMSEETPKRVPHDAE